MGREAMTATVVGGGWEVGGAWADRPFPGASAEELKRAPSSQGVNHWRIGVKKCCRNVGTLKEPAREQELVLGKGQECGDRGQKLELG